MSCSGEMHNSIAAAPSDAMQDEQGNNKVHINHCLAGCLNGTGRGQRRRAIVSMDERKACTKHDEAHSSAQASFIPCHTDCSRMEIIIQSRDGWMEEHDELDYYYYYAHLHLHLVAWLGSKITGD